MGIDATTEESTTYAESYETDRLGKCEQDQQAMLYFYPLFDRYIGAPSDDLEQTSEV